MSLTKKQLNALDKAVKTLDEVVEAFNGQGQDTWRACEAQIALLRFLTDYRKRVAHEAEVAKRVPLKDMISHN